MKFPRWFLYLFLIIGIGLVISAFVVASQGDSGFVEFFLGDFRWGLAIVIGLILTGIALYFTYKVPKDDRHDRNFHPEKEQQRPEKWD